MKNRRCQVPFAGSKAIHCPCPTGTSRPAPQLRLRAKYRRSKTRTLDSVVRRMTFHSPSPISKVIHRWVDEVCAGAQVDVLPRRAGQSQDAYSTTSLLRPKLCPTIPQSDCYAVQRVCLRQSSGVKDSVCPRSSRHRLRHSARNSIARHGIGIDYSTASLLFALPPARLITATDTLPTSVSLCSRPTRRLLSARCGRPRSHEVLPPV